MLRKLGMTWLAEWQGKYLKLCEWVENNIGYPRNIINISKAPMCWSGLTRSSSAALR
jgi:hypothetical protein